MKMMAGNYRFFKKMNKKPTSYIPPFKGYTTLWKHNGQKLPHSASLD